MSGAEDKEVSEGEIQRRVKIVNKRGLHARAAASFVKTVGEFEADIAVHKSGNTVSGISIMGLMMLAAATDCHIDITATGPQAAEAMAALEQLVADRFGEE
jgi:phosphocarrier protein HPr